MGGTVRKGRLTLDDRQAFTDALAQMDGPVVVTVRPATKARSVAQNAYYWGTVVAMLSDHCGYTKPDMHDTLKCLFLPQGVSTADLSVEDMGAYLDAIQGWAWTTLGVSLPPAATRS